jgi:hypothetical protein
MCLTENRLFRFGPESALLNKIELISFNKADLGTNSKVFVSFLLDFGTFVKCLWNICSFTVLTLLVMFSVILNPHQNDQGRKGPCCFQRLIL